MSETTERITGATAVRSAIHEVVEYELSYFGFSSKTEYQGLVNRITDRLVMTVCGIDVEMSDAEITRDVRELLARALAGELCADPENIRMAASAMIEELICVQIAALETAGYRIAPADAVLTAAEREALMRLLDELESWGEMYLGFRADVDILRRLVARRGG